jgi:Protein of unknown function (DUF3575)
MIRIPSLLILFFAVSTNVIAQKEKNNFSKEIFLRTNPSSILEYDAGLMLGVRYQWSKSFSVTVDPTFIFFSPWVNPNTNNEKKFIRGIKARIDVRYHFTGSNKRNKSYFIAPELHLKTVTIKSMQEFGINCLQGNCDYYQLARYKEIRNEIGMALKIGFNTPLGIGDNERFSLEMYGGVGVKFIYLKQKDIPAGGSIERRFSENAPFAWDREGVAYPNLPGAIKISYRIN